MSEKHRIVSEDPEKVSAAVRDLIGESKQAFEHLLSLLHKEVEVISQIEEKDAERKFLNLATMHLGARFHLAAQAGLMLISAGQLIPAVMMSRDMAEILAILRFLHSHPKEAEQFIKAGSFVERMRFSLQRVWKDTEKGESYKAQFDSASAMIHPSSIALGANLRPETTGEVSVFIGPFYQPYPIFLQFQGQIASSFELVWLLDTWYKQESSWPVKTSDLLLLRKTILEHLRQLEAKSAAQDTQLESTQEFFKGKSLNEIETMWKEMDKRKE